MCFPTPFFFGFTVWYEAVILTYPQDTAIAAMFFCPPLIWGMRMNKQDCCCGLLSNL